MISFISKVLSPSTSDWKTQVSEPMLEVEHYYKNRTDIPYYERHRFAKQRLF